MSKKISLEKLTNQQFGYLLLFVIMIVGVGFIFLSDQTLSGKINEAEESARPANIQLTLLTTPDCEDCFDLSAVVSAIQNEAFEVSEQKEIAYASDEGKKIIEQYDIDAVPTVILRGEVEKENVREFMTTYTEMKKDAAVWSVMFPVYILVDSGEEIGRVSSLLLRDSSCDECYDPVINESIVKNQFRVVIDETREVDIKSVEGRKLVFDYDITMVPTIVLSKEASAYPALVEVWKKVGTVEEDGSFVFRNFAVLGDVAYRDLGSGEIINPKIEE